MTYIGLGQVVDPLLMNVNVAILGLRMNMAIQHKWLDYAPGRTARVPIGRYDVLTGFMSDCIIMRAAEWGMGGFVAHIDTVVSNAGVNTAVKQTYAAAMPRQATGFNPTDAWNSEELAAMQRAFNNFNPPYICALVTTAGRFFSVALISDGNNIRYQLKSPY